MPSRFFYLFLVAALLATPALADETDAGAAPISKLEKADKAVEPEAPAEESRMQVPETPKPTGEAPPKTDAAKADDAKADTAKTEETKPEAEKTETPKAEDKAEAMEHHDHEAAAGDDYGPPTLRVSLTPIPKIEKGKKASFTLNLETQDGGQIGEEGLDTRHTKKIHLLVADESFSDYQHIHPEPNGNAWNFSFTPGTAHNYHVWIDVKPKGGHAQMIPLLLSGDEPCKEVCIDKAISMAASFGKNKAALSFEKPLMAGTPAMATLGLTGPDGKPLKGLEPVMGAYAHIVAFPAEGGGPAHVHPMGAEPQKPEDRGASPLTFMVHPEKPGTLKIFVEIAMDNEDIFLPFTTKVGDAAAK